MPHGRIQNTISLVALVLILSASPLPAVQPVAWSGRGSYRLLVEVAPVDLDGRDLDELPAEVEIDWVKRLA